MSIAKLSVACSAGWGEGGSSSVSWSEFARVGRNPKAEELENLHPSNRKARRLVVEVDKYSNYQGRGE